MVIAHLSNADGQIFRNLDFEQLCNSSKTGLCSWNLSWGRKGACSADASRGGNCLLIQAQDARAVGFAEQASIVDTSEGIRIITLSADISTEDVEGKGAGLNVGVYDSDGTLIATKDMGGLYSLDWITGTTDWRRYSIEAVCPDETASINVGAILYGKGKARFDNCRIAFTAIANRTASRLAIDYVSAACETIAKHSLVRDSLNIPDLRTTALQIAGPAVDPAGCYLAIDFLLAALRPYGDHHSFLMQPQEVRNWEHHNSGEPNIVYPASAIIQGCGYILVPPFHAGDQTLMRAYADTLQAQLHILDTSQIGGWIIDLRENTGGNMEPMIAGLGPLFDTKLPGSLIDVDGNPEAWGYYDGSYFWNGEKVMTVPHARTVSPGMPIAVLTSAQTGSSGEAVAISFIGNAKTRLFGQPTWGLTTGNGSFDLSDGARMMLASTIMTDRTGKKYHGPIEPDVYIENSADGIDNVLRAAVKWIVNEH